MSRVRGRLFAVAIVAALIAGCGGASVVVSTEGVEEPPPAGPGQLAKMRAEQAAEDGKWEEAAIEYGDAYQMLDDPQMLFEAGLALTKAEQWSAAIDRFITYLVADRKQVEPQRKYAVDAEIDRLRTIVAGEEPVTWRSLADQIYAERRGEEPPMEQPPPPPEPDPIYVEPEPEPEPEPVAKEEEDELLDEAVTEETASMYQPVPVEPRPAELKTPPQERSAPTLDELLFYSGSKSSSVRMRAVRDLAAHPDDRARQALEKRAQSDTNMRVRIAAIEGLVARGSLASIPLLKQLVLTAATSQERAVIKSAIAELLTRRGYPAP